MATNLPTAAPAHRSAAAERMRRHREGLPPSALDERTVAIVPHVEQTLREWIAKQPKNADAKTPEWVRWHLHFGADGRLGAVRRRLSRR